MNESLSIEEIRKHQLYPDASEYKVVRYEIDVDPEAQRIDSIVLSLRSKEGDLRKLRFQNPTLADFGPLQIPHGPDGTGVYIVDTRFRGLEPAVRIEVGALGEDRPTFFWAEHVEEV